MRHELKTWPEAFQAISEGRKTFEIRKADRLFSVGDVLTLREWVPAPELGWVPTSPRVGEYTGLALDVEVTYVTALGAWGLPPGLCVMGIKRC